MTTAPGNRSQPPAPTAATPALTVVVPTFQRRDLVLDVLAALAVQTLEKNRFQVIVVCDGCTDGSADALREASQPGGRAAGCSLEVIEQRNSGAATARNTGAAAAAASLVLFLDDDMLAAPDLLQQHLEHHQKCPEGIAIGHLPVHESSPGSYLTVGLARWVNRRHEMLSRPGAQVPVDEVLTGQMSMSLATFNRLGGFDSRFTADGTFGGEDVELGWRARRRSIPVTYLPGAISHQVYRKTFAALCRNIRDAGAADIMMAATHPEVASHLPLGQVESMPLLQRLSLKITRRFPGLMRILFAPILWTLDRTADAGSTARLLEHFHGVARAHLYGLGMLDGKAAAASRSTA